MTDSERYAQWLHHLGMRYIGAIAEVARGQPVGFLKHGDPGVHETRDLISLLLLVRAELNGLTKLLHDKGIVTGEELQKTFAAEYKWFAETKAKALGVEVHDAGISFKFGPKAGEN